MPRNRSLYSPYSRRLATSRRRFLQGGAAALAGMALSNCRQGGVSDVQAPDTETGNGNGGEGGGGSDTLHIYTWADYVDEELTAAFTAETGIQVVTDIYDSNETMLARLQAGGGSAYSIIYPSDYMVEEMIELDLLTTLDQDRVEGLDTMLDQWVSPAYDPDNVHSVPFSWGTTGLLFNRELVSGDPEDWDYLWDNQQALNRRFTLLDDVRETMGAVLKSLGYSYNATDPDELEEAFERLMELRPAIAAFRSFGWEDELLGGDLDLVMSYSVDAIAATLEDPAFEYVIPLSGSSVWTDTLVIPETAPNVDAAYEWINFNLDANVAAQTVERLFFATPNSEALDLIDDDLLANEDLFPPDEILARCEGIAPVGPEASALYDRYWTEVTSA